MFLAAQVINVSPVYSQLHELQRATFQVAGMPETFVAFSSAAQAVVSADTREARVEIEASSRVTLLNHEQAILVDRVRLTEGI